MVAGGGIVEGESERASSCVRGTENEETNLTRFLLWLKFIVFRCGQWGRFSFIVKFHITDIIPSFYKKKRLDCKTSYQNPVAAQTLDSTCLSLSGRIFKNSGSRSRSWRSYRLSSSIRNMRTN